MTICPIIEVRISVSPVFSRRRTIPETIWSSCSSETGRFCSAIRTERRSFSRSNTALRPSRLTTISSRSCTRSKVVNRPPHCGQPRRRRTAVSSSAGRLSFTTESEKPQ